MSKSSPLILAVDPGIKYVGIAVLFGAELQYYGIKTVTKHHSPNDVLNEITGTIGHLISQYKPTFLAIEQPFISKNDSSLLVVVAEQIKAIARQNGLLVYEYAPTSVKKRLCRTGRATKRVVAKVISERYPYLASYYARTSYWEQQYYGNMFDAIAVGLVCYQDIAGYSSANRVSKNTQQQGTDSLLN